MPCSVPVLLLAEVNGICNVFLECLYFFLKKKVKQWALYIKKLHCFSAWEIHLTSWSSQKLTGQAPKSHHSSIERFRPLFEQLYCVLGL